MCVCVCVQHFDAYIYIYIYMCVCCVLFIAVIKVRFCTLRLIFFTVSVIALRCSKIIFLQDFNVIFFNLNVTELCQQVTFGSSIFYTNNCATRCNTKQSIYYSASSLYMFRVSTTPIIRNTQNCNYSLRYWSYFLCCYAWPR